MKKCICGCDVFKLVDQTFSNGTKHVRAQCASCEKFIQYVKTTSSYDQMFFEHFKINPVMTKKMFYELIETYNTKELQNEPC